MGNNDDVDDEDDDDDDNDDDGVVDDEDVALVGDKNLLFVVCAIGGIFGVVAAFVYDGIDG